MDVSAHLPGSHLIRDAAPGDFATILRLNQEWVHFTSRLDEASLGRLHDLAAYHRVVVADGVVAAFLLALREGAPYDSPNYRWFADRREHFLYIDRVIVDAHRRRLGLAQALYADVIAFAHASGAPSVVCELDIEPPNAASAAFHDRLGFAEVGTQQLESGKRVSLRELALR